MPDAYWQHEDIPELIEQLVASGTKSVKRKRLSCFGSPIVYDKGSGIHDIEIRTVAGTKRFTNAVVDPDSEHDVQSELGDVFSSDWIDPPLEDDADSVEPSIDQREQPLAILARLERAIDEDCRQLIIEVEAIPFEGQERDRLVWLLKDYIEENRDSTSRDKLISVAAAIRKCVALLDVADLGWLSTLLESGHRVQPSLDAVLEIAKMVFRRYSQSPPDHSDPHPELSERLAEIASDFLRPHVFNRDRFSTVAMLATQALIVMRSERARAIIDQVNELPFAWFRQQLHRRMDKVVQQMPADAPGIDELRNLIDAIPTN